MSGHHDIARSPALTARDGDLRRLEETLAEATASRAFRVALVRGPAGVGRTALLEALTGRADESVVVVSVAAPRASSAVWSLAGSVADRVLALLRPGTALPRMRALESRLAPLRGEVPEARSDRLDCFAALAEAVNVVARDRSLLLVIDDMDAADAASLGALSYLVTALATPPACRASDEGLCGGLVVLSLRDDGPLPAPLQDLIERTPALSLPLAPLDVEGVRAWLTGTGAVERLLSASGGVPGRLEALLHAPATIDLGSRRLAGLAAADHEVLSVLALAGLPVGAKFVASVSGRRDVVARLDRLVRGAFAVATPGAGRTMFSLARSADVAALCESVPASRRLAIAEALAAQGVHDRAFELLADAGEGERAVVAGIEAARHFEQACAFESAQSVLSRAARLAAPTSLRRDVLLSLARVLERSDDVRGALAALGRARALSAPPARRAIRARAARLCLPLGAPRAAQRLATRVLEEGRDDAAGFDALVALADARFLQGAWQEAITLANELSNAPVEHRVAVENVRGKALLCLGRLEEAHRTFSENARRAQALPGDRARALLNVGVVAHRMGRVDDARAAYREVLAQGRGPLAPLAHANLASLLLSEGDAEQALLQSHRALTEFAHLGRRKEQAHAAQNLARVYLYLGDLPRADEVAAHALQLSLRVGDPYVEAGARLVGAEVQLLRGADEAAQQLLEVADRFRTLENVRYLQESLLLAAGAWLQSANIDAAQEALDEARAAGALDTPSVAAEWHLVDAELSLSRQPPDIEEAARSLSEARRCLLDEPQLELPARLHSLAAQVSELRGELSAAETSRVQAARVLEELAGRLSPDRRTFFFAVPRRREILEAAGRALPKRQVEPRRTKVQASERALVGHHPAIERINTLVERIGPSTVTVLLRGESGTGKELVARALHERSARRDLPLVTVNCGALGDELLLSELFGHEKGAFTGAVRERKGRFELADGGTLFLDEIGDISPRAQVALLRVLQERTFERVGGGRTLSVDVRIVCATNRDLEALMARGEFREDLYYRLRGAMLTLPALRERMEDLPELAAHCFERAAADSGAPARRLSREALALLSRHLWPGNVRELFNTLDSAATLSSDEVLGPEAFELFPELFESSQGPASVVPAPPSVDFYGLLKSRELSLRELRHDVELECIARALEEGGGNISEAARLLKVKRSRLSQIVNEEPRLRALTPAADEDEGADDGAALA